MNYRNPNSYVNFEQDKNELSIYFFPLSLPNEHY